MTFEKTARIASAREIAIYRKNPTAHKAKGIRLVREQGNWLIINLNKFVSQDFWKAWRTQRAEVKAAGYSVAKAFDHWVVY